jgi:seryl-tRNA synthetase
MVEFVVGAVKVLPIVGTTGKENAMVVMLQKLRTIWRWTTDAAMPNASPAPAPTSSSDSVPVIASKESSTQVPPEEHASLPAPAPKRPSTRVQRITNDVTSLRGDMRTLESKIDAIQSRSDRLLQTIQSSGPRESVDLGELRGELQALRAQVEEHRQQQANLLESYRQIASRSQDLDASTESLASRLEKHSARLAETQERQADLAARFETLQLTMQNTIESINVMRADLATHEALRSREVAGRMVGLYIIGCIALTVAIATLVIVMTGAGIRH